MSIISEDIGRARMVQQFGRNRTELSTVVLQDRIDVFYRKPYFIDVMLKIQQIQTRVKSEKYPNDTILIVPNLPQVILNLDQNRNNVGPLPF